ncbi:hypothetical protein ASPFODRAFT_57909 [Aspergillus luchuensis CBS 106.47]|uniref:Uncharacterized protein n=1 Tax=Aspergillus luchuensis (strain CBS 106.47) TaxID=1137211 RepID=A0A1M3TQI9_ASPLC|nr:hypothetical protein ASPFODRAFT_57909 [Aspergillus luchuensis CBS 106.47]
MGATCVDEVCFRTILHHKYCTGIQITHHCIGKANGLHWRERWDSIKQSSQKVKICTCFAAIDILLPSPCTNSSRYSRQSSQ